MSLQIRMALRYLWGRKTRTILTTLSVVFGVMIIFGLNGVVPSVANSFRQNLMATVNQVDMTITSESRGTFSADVLATVSETPGVAYVTGSLTAPVILPASDAPLNQNGTPISSLLLNGLDPVTSAQVRPLTMDQGRGLQAGDGNVLVIGLPLATKTGLTVGDTLRLPSASGSTPFTIVGVAAVEPTLGADEAYAPLAAVQTLLNHPGEINTIEVLFTPNSNGDAVRQAVMDRLGSSFVMGAINTSGELLGWLDVATFIITLFGSMALVMGGFVIFNTFRTVVIERRRDIGMLRAVGASRSTITGIMLTESLIQGIVGTALGMILGYLLVVLALGVIGPIWYRDDPPAAGQAGVRTLHLRAGDRAGGGDHRAERAAAGPRREPHLAARSAAPGRGRGQPAHRHASDSHRRGDDRGVAAGAGVGQAGACLAGGAGVHRGDRGDRTGAGAAHQPGNRPGCCRWCWPARGASPKAILSDSRGARPSPPCQ